MRKAMRTTFVALVLLVAAAAAAGAATWTIDTTHSVLTFKVRHLFSHTEGKFTDWSGKLEFDPADLTKGSAMVAIKATSVSTNNDKRDEHLRSADFFDVANHPEITFKSDSITKTDNGFAMTGELNIRGVAKQVTIPFELVGMGKDPWGNTRAGFNGSVTVNRQDFGIKWNKALDAGGTLLGDDVTIDIEVEAAQQAS